MRYDTPEVEHQFQYLGRWVPIEGFRAWVHGVDDARSLANSHKEFKELLATGLWWADKKDVKAPKLIKAVKKVKRNGANS